MKKYFIYICLVLFCSCNQEENIIYERTSRMIIGNNEYDKVYKQINDSITNWIENKLTYFDVEELNKSIKIDKIVCYNISKNRFVTCLLAKTLKYPNPIDGIHFFYGEKIQDTWYFFQGAHIVLPREMYQSDIHTPLSFEKLHEIALKEVFSGYLKKKEPIVPFWKFWQKQEYEVDESWFDSHFDISDLGYDDDSQKRIFKQFKDSITQPFKNRDSFEEYYFKNISNPYLFK